MTTAMAAADFRRWLHSNGLTQGEFARFVGAHERTVSDWCCERRPVPSWVPPMLGLLGEVSNYGQSPAGYIRRHSRPKER